MTETVTTRALVDAAGPWVSQVIADVLGIASRHHVRMVMGSHIVVSALYPGEHAYVLQNEAGASSSPFPIRPAA